MQIFNDFNKMILPLLLGLSFNALATTQVDVFIAQEAPLNKTISLAGTIQAHQNAELAPLVSGVVEKLFFEVGDTVVAGQKLLVIDSHLAQLNVQQAKALLLARQAEKNEAQRLHQEMVNLSKRELVAKTLLNERISQLEIANAVLAQAKAELASKTELLNRHTLYAPFSGVVYQRYIDLGEWVVPQKAVLTLVEQARSRLKVEIPQEFYHQVIDNQEIDVKVTADFNGAQMINAKLDRIVAVANQNTRTITGLINLPIDPALVAGMSANALIMLPAPQESLVWLPKSAIKQHPDGGTSVFIVENNKAKRILVTVVKRENQQVAVTGLTASQPVVMSGVELLKNDDPLQIKSTIGNRL